MSADSPDPQIQEISNFESTIEWFKTRLTLTTYKEGDWTNIHDQAVFDFLTSPNSYRLFASYDENGTLSLNTMLPCESVNELIFFLRTPSKKVDTANLADTVQWGQVFGRAVNTLITSLDGFYMPLFVKSAYLPNSIREDLMPGMNKFLGYVTETANAFYGQTVLYVPQEELTDPKCVQDRALIQRLESTVIQWTRQLKTPVPFQVDVVGPLAEIEYWNFRYKTTLSLKQQIESTTITQIISVLTAAKSRYLAEFQGLYTKMKEESTQAQAIIRHLQVLIEPCNQLSNGEVSECTDLLRKILFAILFIYQRCEYYKDEAHLSTLLKKVGDLVMNFISSKIDLDNVFSLEGDVNQGLEILTTAVTVGANWNKAYNTALKAVRAQNPNAWNFDHTELFANFDAFISRCGDLKEICQNTIQFSRKKGTEIQPIPVFPGSIGGAISGSLQEIQNSYAGILSKLSSTDCNVFDVSDNSWHQKFTEYGEACSNLESLLLNAIQTQFEAAKTPILGLQLLEIFDSLAVRDGVKHLISVKCGELWKLFEQDVVSVRREFENLKTNPPLPAHQPIKAGTIIWAKSLLYRIQQPFEKMQTASSWLPTYTYKDEIIASYSGIVSSIQDFIKNTYNEYHRNLADSIRALLQKQVLTKPTSNSLKCNIDPKLLTATEEASHFYRMDYEISKAALELTQIRERNKLLSEAVLLVVRDYNAMYQCLRVDEQQLFNDDFKEIEIGIRSALTPKINWSNPQVVNSFVNSNVKSLHHLHSIIVGFKQTVWKISDLCQKISKISTVQIQPGKRVFSIHAFKELQAQQHAASIELVHKYHEQAYQTISDMFSKFTVNSNAVRDEWLSFLINIDQQFEAAFKQAVNKSLIELKRCLLDETNPLFSAETCLLNGECAITPNYGELDGVITDTIQSTINLCQEFAPMYWDLKDSIRMDANDDAYNPDEEYSTEDEIFTPELYHFKAFIELIGKDGEINGLTNEINSIIHNAKAPLEKHILSWKIYEPIWKADKKETLEQLSRVSQSLTTFETNIQKYKDQAAEIQAMEPVHAIFYIRLNASPLQNALLSHCSDWVSRLITMLSKVSHDQLLSFYQMFHEDTQKLQVVPQNIPQLAEMLDFMVEVKESIPTTEAKFAPLQENFDALAKYEFPIDSKDLELLNSLADRWKEFKEAVTLAEKQLAGHRDQFKKQHLAEVEEIRNLQAEMYNQFLIDEPFKAIHGVKNARAIIQKYKNQVKELRERENGLRPGCELFKLDPPVYKEISSVETDLGLLEQIWGLEEEWNIMWDNWRTDPFQKLEVASMEASAMAHGKAVQSIGIKNWEVANVLANKIQLFKKTMPLISNLKEPSIRQRHWNTLMNELGVTFDPTSPTFTLNTIFEMKFNEYSDIIATIAITAKKEYEIEQGLEEINSRWSDLHFEIEPHRGSFKLVEADKIYEMIDQDQTILSGMKATLSSMKATRYFIAFDQQPINKLEQNLTSVLELLDFILTVQRQWIYLESIFNGSETIRKQIPNEASEFSKVNTKWKEVMDYLRRDTTTAMRGAQEADIIKKLIDMNEKLEQIQKVLESFLESKRRLFPRFYFLSNDDLLEIIGKQKDPNCVAPHLKKMFGAITKILFENVQSTDGKNQVYAKNMSSAEGEVVEFETPVPVVGDVERWLLEIEKEMRHTIHSSLNKCKTEMSKANIQQRVGTLKDDTYPGQCFITASQIKWTAECERALDAAQKANTRITAQSHPLTQLIGMQILFLGELTNLVRGELTPLLRKKIKALLIIEDHAKDVIQELIKYGQGHGGQVSKDDFVWLKQLRFYWLKENEYCTIQQTFSTFEYDKEYIGNNPRLVITPLTDRCYLTLTSALHFKCGGNPQGPAGTGKTETVKDLAKAFAKFCIVFNCSEGLDFKSMGNIFSGLAQTGGWSCFDEFNRIEIEVLSVVAQEVNRLLDAIAAGAKEVCLESTAIPLNPTCAIFVTMNPGYAGRTELPDNLKSLLRPVAMMVPDCSLIVKIELMSEGVLAKEDLARKIVTLYDLAKRQLSKQDHYDFGLRAIKSVLSMAGSLKRVNSGVADELLLMRAMRDMNIPKLVAEDIPLFNAMLSDLFPGSELEQAPPGALEIAIGETLTAKSLQNEPGLTQKIVQLYDSMQTRHGNMLVGKTGSGKSTAWKVLSHALTLLKKQGNTKYEEVETFLLNPKALSLGELYGEYDLNTRQWSEGVLSTVIRDVSTMDSTNSRWVIFDGPVDTLWIESMNSVLDDNKVLTLINSSRISLPQEVSLLFEVEDLAVASPATVSRCGMVYLEATTLGYKPYVQSWIQRSISNERHRNKIQTLINKYLEVFIDFKHQALHDLIPITDLNAVQTFCSLYETLATPDNEVKPDDEIYFDPMVEAWFWFCLVWSIGGSLDEEGRKEADLWVRELESPFPPKDTIFDYYVDVQKHAMTLWEEKLPSQWKRHSDVPFNRILVPTVDTLRNSFILQTVLQGKKNALFVGHSGAGKTAIIANTLNNLDSHTSSLTINLSSRTTSNKLQEMIEDAFEIRTKGTYFPIGGKQLAVFIDDFNMPQKDRFGSQPPLELLRQWIETESWYDREKCSLKYLRQMQIIGAMAPPGGGRQQISNRLQSKFILMNVTLPADSQLKRIYGLLLESHVSTFCEEVQTLVEPLTMASLDLFQNVSKQFLPTPKKSHYIFNLRDLTKVYQGLLDSSTNYFDDRSAFIKLWAHECFRVFADRLVDEEDRYTFSRLLQTQLNTTLSTTWSALFRDLPEPTPHGNFVPEGAANPYRELGDSEELNKFINEQLADYNETGNRVPMNLVLFKEVIYHTCRVLRIIGRQFGHALLVGLGGSGKQSITRLAAHVLGYQFFQIQMTKNYRDKEFREDLKKLLDLTAIEQKPTVFYFPDSHILKESFLEDVNFILSSGCVPNLFEDDELAQRREAMRAEAKKRGIHESPQALFDLYVQISKENLHIVMGMSPAGTSLRNRVRMFPSIVNSTTIDWFNEWPDSALSAVAANLMQGADIEDSEIRQKILASFVEFHKLADKEGQRMANQLKRPFQLTPTIFLSFVSNYKSLLRSKKLEIINKSQIYRNGLDTLVTTRKEVETMSLELEKKKKSVADSQAKCEQMTERVHYEQHQLKEQEKLVNQETEQLAKEEARILEQQEEAELKFAQAKPVMDDAMEALEKLQKNVHQIHEIAEYKTFHGALASIVEALMVLLGKSTSWTAAKAEMKDASFVQNLGKFDKDNISKNTLKKLGRYMRMKDLEPSVAAQSSKAGALLAQWIGAMYQYGLIYQEVHPLQEAVERVKAMYEEKLREIEIKQARLQSLRLELENLKKERADINATKERLEKEAQETEVRLERANRLINGLAGERKRWEEAIKNFDQLLLWLPGDCFLASSFLCYAGPFPSDFRQALMSKWKKHIRGLKIPFNPEFSVNLFFNEPIDIQDWHINDLAADEFSEENGTLVLHSERWPLCVDPQNQANKWIKKMYKDNLQILTTKKPNFVNALELALQNGQPCLLQDIGEEIDPSLMPILNREFVKQGNQYMFKLSGDRLVTLNPDFRLFITTKIANPIYTPEVTSRVTLVNFTVKEQGLEEQMLGIVVGKERPDLEGEKKRLVTQMAHDKQTLFKTEQQILELLASTAGNELLNNDDLVSTLENSKHLNQNITEKLKSSTETEKKIDAARDAYRSVASRAAILFFVLSDLSYVDPMYQFSLDAYITLFNHSLSRASHSDDIGERNENIKATHTLAVYVNTCRGLFECHKLLFSFCLAIKIQLCEESKGINKINPEEYLYFLRGPVNINLESVDAGSPPEWLGEVEWDNIVGLSTLPAFEGIANSFEQYSDDWLEWYMEQEPEAFPFPGEWTRKCNTLQSMIIVRCLRPDRVLSCVRSFVTQTMGQEFITPPALDLGQAYKDSDAYTPLLFVLSPGVDPLTNLRQFISRNKGKESTFRDLALGQGQATAARELLYEGSKNGWWIYLGNCHLMLSWMDEFESIMEELSLSKLHPEFRLWLSSDPHPKFPISILQKCVKMTTEPPSGIHSNMESLFCSIPADEFDASSTQSKTLTFALCFLHAIIIERRKFLSLGWNIPYSFNQSDFRISTKVIKRYVDKPISWEALRYLISDIHYGGRVTDSWDQRLLDVYVRQYFCPELLSVQNFQLSTHTAYYVPDTGAHADYLQFIHKMPSSDPPSAFGQHPNADISSLIQESGSLLSTVLSLQPSTGSTSGASREEVVLGMAKEILLNLPLEILVGHQGPSMKDPLQIVLFQEIARYNQLLSKIRTSLNQLILGIQGMVVMSEDLDQIFQSLYDGQVPAVWKSAYPSLKTLSQWTKDLAKRVSFFRKWFEKGEPRVFWLGRFTYPTSFLTAVLQRSARTHRISIDQLDWDFEVLATSNPRELQSQQFTGEGVLVRGLILEGARWSKKEQCLVNPKPLQLDSELPIVRFVPIDKTKKKTTGVYTAPCYIYPVRGGTSESPSLVLPVELPTEFPSEHWVKRGTALLLSKQ